MNNVNVQETEIFIATIQEDPAQAKKHKQVTGSWVFEQGKPQFASTLEYAKGSVVLSTELPPFSGGWGTSPDPVQVCLYGLAACFAATFAATAASEGVQLARALGEHAIPSTLIVDAGVASFVGRADAVLVGSDAVSGGFFVFNREVFDYLDENSILEKEPLEQLAADGQLAGYRHDGFWQCMDTRTDLRILNELWASGDAPWQIWD